eukprot:scaffold9516_cov92-Cylindrotheca_fusiformis.AAC.4
MAHISHGLGWILESHGQTHSTEGRRWGSPPFLSSIDYTFKCGCALLPETNKGIFTLSVLVITSIIIGGSITVVPTEGNHKTWGTFRPTIPSQKKQAGCGAANQMKAPAIDESTSAGAANQMKAAAIDEISKIPQSDHIRPNNTDR